MISLWLFFHIISIPFMRGFRLCTRWILLLVFFSHFFFHEWAAADEVRHFRVDVRQAAPNFAQSSIWSATLNDGYGDRLPNFVSSRCRGWQVYERRDQTAQDGIDFTSSTFTIFISILVPLWRFEEVFIEYEYGCLIQPLQFDKISA